LTARRRARPRRPRPVDRARARLDGAAADRRPPDAVDRGRRRAVGVPGGRHDRRRQVRGAALPGADVSYTLRGRIGTRLLGTVPALLVAIGLHRWWAIELVAVMLAVGIVLDVAVYDRILQYQPGWLAVPLGALELALIYGIVRALSIPAPVDLALLLFGIAWLTAQ